MFRQMRRKRQEISREDCELLLRAGSYGTLALAGDDGYPYAVPLSYVYYGGAVYFHGAAEGHKIDATDRCSKASFCVVTRDETVPEKFTTRYESVIVFGRISVLKEPEEIYEAAYALGQKYCPQADKAEIDGEIRAYAAAMTMLKLEIEHMSGKRGRELLD